MSKLCNRCGCEITSQNFTTSTTNRCKECYNLMQRMRYAENSELNKRDKTKPLTFIQQWFIDEGKRESKRRNCIGDMLEEY